MNHTTIHFCVKGKGYMPLCGIHGPCSTIHPDLLPFGMMPHERPCPTCATRASALLHLPSRKILAPFIPRKGKAHIPCLADELLQKMGITP